MILDDTTPLNVFIQYRNHQFETVPAFQVNNVIFRDENDPRNNSVRRYFWLLEHKVQMVFDPINWKNEWRIDLVDINIESNNPYIYKVVDMALDIVVENMGPTYRILDMDDLGERLESGEFTISQVTGILSRTQLFLDSFIHRGAPWPPPEIRPFFAIDHNYPNPDKI